jgi:hypothetical protein
MTEIGFAPKEIIEPQVCRLEVLAADKAEAYGLQVGLKLKIVGGEHDGHSFTDYANRDEDTGQIRQGSKAWSVFEACLGADFDKRPGVGLKDLVGKQFVAKVTQTRTGSRNKIEFGAIGSVPPEERNPAPKPEGGGNDEDRFNYLPW